MVTSTKLPDKKVVKMAEQNNGVVVPQRTLLGEVNEHIMCPLCRGYYIDATTIVECLHSFCRSCIIKHLQVKSYCPVCEMMINSAKPNIKLDKALQDIVYKLVPGLFQREMERRQQFYASRPGPAASATPEQRGEDTERIIFSPEDVISFSLEYADATDTDSISSKSSDSNEAQPQTAASRRYLQCPAVVNISHLKKFLSMKFDIDSTQFAIDILYKRVPLPDYYTLMDIAYIYNWKRNEPMRFFYQIIDYVAIRNRLFDINRKGTHFRDRKQSPASTEDTNVGSPAPHLNDQASEASSGTDSPMPEDSGSKQVSNISKKSEESVKQSKSGIPSDHNSSALSAKKNDDEVEKSQFLNSFELTAKNSNSPPKTSPSKNSTNDNNSASEASPEKTISTSKAEDTMKRKQQTLPSIPEMKRLKVELEKTKLPETAAPIKGSTTSVNQTLKADESSGKSNEIETSLKIQGNQTSNKMPTGAPKEIKQYTPLVKQSPDSSNIKRPVSQTQGISSPKKKINEGNSVSMQQPLPTTNKTVSPLKLQVPKSEASSASRPMIAPKSTVKKIPDLKPSIALPQTSSQIKGQPNPPVNKVRMDLLANNCDPTMDRTKILSQVKSSMNMQVPSQTSGDPLKSLFNSCNINIPSSLSITLTDQKQDPRNPSESAHDTKTNIVNKNLAGANNATSHKVPSPPVHNYIEILKLPDSDPKKQNKTDGASDNKSNTSNKIEPPLTQPKPTKSSETSAKGPIPNLKPIADTKLGKHSGSSTSAGAMYAGAITFQQTFEKQLQSLQSDKKSKLLKNKAQVPKLVPANPKTFNAATKLNNALNKPNPSVVPPSMEPKPTAALDLSTPATNIPSQLTAHQTKAFETMQSIANLAKKQNLPSKGPSPLPQSYPSASSRPLPAAAPLRLSSNSGQLKQDKLQINSSAPSSLINTLRQEISNKSSPVKPPNHQNPATSSPTYQLASHNLQSPAQPSPRSQTRSPSSSPKLVIAEEKQTSHPEPNVNQSNQISSTQVSNSNNAPKSESPKTSPGPSKPGMKLAKPIPPANKIAGPIRQPITPIVKPCPNPSPADFQFISAQHAFLRHMEMNAWLKAQRIMSNMAHQAQNELNKDKQ